MDIRYDILLNFQVLMFFLVESFFLLRQGFNLMETTVLPDSATNFSDCSNPLK